MAKKKAVKKRTYKLPDPMEIQKHDKDDMPQYLYECSGSTYSTLHGEQVYEGDVVGVYKMIGKLRVKIQASVFERI